MLPLDLKIGEPEGKLWLLMENVRLRSWLELCVPDNSYYLSILIDYGNYIQ